MVVKTKCKLSTRGFLKGKEYKYEFKGRKYRVYLTEKDYKEFKYADFIVYFM